MINEIREIITGLAIKSTEKVFGSSIPIDEVMGEIKARVTMTTLQACNVEAAIKKYLKPSDVVRLKRSDIEPFTCVTYNGDVYMVTHVDEDGDLRLYGAEDMSGSEFIGSTSIREVTRPSDDEIRQVVNLWCDEFHAQTD